MQRIVENRIKNRHLSLSLSNWWSQTHKVFMITRECMFTRISIYIYTYLYTFVCVMCIYIYMYNIHGYMYWHAMSLPLNLAPWCSHHTLICWFPMEMPRKSMAQWVFPTEVKVFGWPEEKLETSAFQRHKHTELVPELWFWAQLKKQTWRTYFLDLFGIDLQRISRLLTGFLGHPTKLNSDRAATFETQTHS